MRTRLAALVLLPALAGCSVFDGGDDRLADLRAARSRWAKANVMAYAFDLRVGCFCVPTDGRVSVEDGRVVAFDAADPERSARDDYWIRPVEGLFDRIADLAANDPDVLDVTYDARTGVPTRIEYDNRRLFDDELLVTLTGFTVE